MYILRIISVFILLNFYNIAFASDRPARFDKPGDVVAWLYRDFGWEAFIGQYFHEIINDQPKSVLQRYFTPKLSELIVKERKFEIETKQVGPPGFMLLFGSRTRTALVTYELIKNQELTSFPFYMTRTEKRTLWKLIT